ncbi:MAG: Trm112 family protein [Myxococcota bacterium]|mgnify:CR=1 FL=1
MSISPELLEILACPKCKTPMAPDGKLRLREDGSGFECEACRLLYKIEDDIPNFLIDEAAPLDR